MIVKDIQDRYLELAKRQVLSMHPTFSIFAYKVLIPARPPKPGLYRFWLRERPVISISPKMLNVPVKGFAPIKVPDPDFFEPDEHKNQGIYRKLFQAHRNQANWKLPPPPVILPPDKAKWLYRAYVWILGGAELESLPDGNIRVTSKGYYHYTGGS